MKANRNVSKPFRWCDIELFVVVVDVRDMEVVHVLILWINMPEDLEQVLHASLRVYGLINVPCECNGVPSIDDVDVEFFGGWEFTLIELSEFTIARSWSSGWKREDITLGYFHLVEQSKGQCSILYISPRIGRNGAQAYGDKSAA